MNWCKDASIKNAKTRTDVAKKIKDRCLLVIDEYMEMYYIKETEQQKTTYQGQLDMMVLECEIAAAEILELDKEPVNALRTKLPEKAKELKIIPPAKAGTIGQ